MPEKTIVRLLFVDDGSYHREDIAVPGEGMERYERLIDFLREEPAVLGDVYVDVGRLCAAWLVDEAEAEADDGGGAGSAR